MSPVSRPLIDGPADGLLPADQGAAADFLRTFALPLCRGGQLHVGAPLGLSGLARLREAAELGGLDRTGPGKQLAEVRQRLAREITPRAPRPLLSGAREELYLLCGLHDLLFLLHPAAGELMLGERRLRRVLDHALTLLLAAQPERTPGDIVGLARRHSLLHNLWALQRQDVRVTFWAGARTFHGVEPPERLLAWRRVRRVHEERWLVGVAQQLGALWPEAGSGKQAVSLLLGVSPLSDLLSPRRAEPPFDLSRHAALLGDPLVCRALVARYLDLGLPVVGGVLARAALDLLALPALPNKPAPPGTVTRVLGLLSHLQLCTLLAPEPPGPAPGPGADPALGDLYALYAVLLRRYPALALPVDAPAELRARAAEHAAAASQAVGAARLHELTVLCQRALGPTPEPSELKIGQGRA